MRGRGMKMLGRVQVHEGIAHILDAFPAIKLPRKYTVLRTCWGANPLQRGSYSYISAESSTSDVETLSQPLVPLSCPTQCVDVIPHIRHGDLVHIRLK